MIKQSINIFEGNMSVESLSFDELAGWTARIQIELQRGTQLSINGKAVTLDRLREYFNMSLTVEKARELFGANYEAILPAVQTGVYVPGGDIEAELIAEAVAQLGE